MSQEQAPTYTSNVKIDTNAKGFAVVTVHVYDNDDHKAAVRAVSLYQQTKKVLRATGTKVLEVEA